MPLILFWDRFNWGLGLKTFIFLKNFYYRVGNKSIQIFAFCWALLSALEPYAACAAVLSGWPSQLYGFGLWQYELALFHAVYRAMQRAHGWFFVIIFCLLVSSSKAFVASYDPLRCAYLAYWWRPPGWFFVLFWRFPPPCVWKTYSAVLRHLNNYTSSVRLWLAESNPWMMSYFCHY